MSNELMVIEVTDDMAPVVYVAGGLDKYFDMVKDAVSGEVPDLTTKKGRDRIASLAAQVSRSKTAVERPGRAYLKRLKEMPKTVEAELREWVNNCDNLRDEVRRPLTEWEEEQKLIEAERIAAEEAERLRLQIESDHEIALLMNEKFDREREEERKAAEAAMVERDRRSADRAHRGAVNSKIKSELIELGLSDEQAIAVIKAMAKGEISNVKITY